MQENKSIKKVENGLKMTSIISFQRHWGSENPGIWLGRDLPGH